MRKMKNKYGSTINVVEHIILKNNWEYYITDAKTDDADIVEALVMGFEQEMGDVYMPEIKPHIRSRTTNLEELLPAKDWTWV